MSARMMNLHARGKSWHAVCKVAGGGRGSAIPSDGESLED